MGQSARTQVHWHRNPRVTSRTSSPPLTEEGGAKPRLFARKPLDELCTAANGELDIRGWSEDLGSDQLADRLQGVFELVTTGWSVNLVGSAELVYETADGAVSQANGEVLRRHGFIALARSAAGQCIEKAPLVGTPSEDVSTQARCPRRRPNSAWPRPERSLHPRPPGPR